MKRNFIFAAIAFGVITGPAAAEIMTIDFTGILLNTTDETGTVFRNGTAANSGAGTEISGHITWDFAHSRGFGASGYFNYYELDYSYCYVGCTSGIQWDANVGGNTYSGNMNFGSHHLSTLNDREAGAPADLFSLGLHSYGHYQLTPESGGTFDYLAVDRHFGFTLTDPSGATVNGLEFPQTYDWVSGVDGYGTGYFHFLTQIWEDGGPRVRTGTAGTILTDSMGDFVLTSLHSTVAVPEPTTLGLFALGLAGLAFGRRKVGRNRLS